ncbi:MAG: DUF5106 domain-containing protein [Muribaculaceae bacterium]|nr:DUF5106 domain-containing protein [Muribaculaceae bacterium]
MNRIIISILTLISAFVASADTWFPYPAAPEALPFGRPRANYIVEHFWDRCPWKSAYSSKARMAETIADFASFIPHAQADTVFTSINVLIKNSQKKPDDFRTLLNIARAQFYSDTTSTFSPEVYLPFAEAAAVFKKFNHEERANYLGQAMSIKNSTEGSPIPSLEVFDINGNKSNLNDTIPGIQTYILIFERPEAGRTERVFFSANISVNKLTEAGLIQPILICAGTPDQNWWDSTKNLPQGWRAVALPNAETLFDLRANPSVYMTDPNMIITSRLIPISYLTANCENLVKSAGL